MLECPDLAGTSGLALAGARKAAPVRYGGPERRSISSLEFRRMAQVIDEIGYGMLLLDQRGRVQHVNKSARADLDDRHPLRLVGSELRTRPAAHLALLREAVTAAAERGLRRLLQLGEGESRIDLAVVPLPGLGRDSQHAVLLSLGKRRVAEELSVNWFAQCHGLTPAETVVLKALCADLTPQQIAARQQVGLATVRTQISSLRTKTGNHSIKALVRRVAMLPPLVGALDLPLPAPAGPASATGAGAGQARGAAKR